jgi:hypothetical protein
MTRDAITADLATTTGAALTSWQKVVLQTFEVTKNVK